jgi:hypothetical protein
MPEVGAHPSFQPGEYLGVIVGIQFIPSVRDTTVCVEYRLSGVGRLYQCFSLTDHGETVSLALRMRGDYRNPKNWDALIGHDVAVRVSTSNLWIDDDLFVISQVRPGSARRAGED